jgi:hypothetical protein
VKENIEGEPHVASVERHQKPVLRILRDLGEEGHMFPP